MSDTELEFKMKEYSLEDLITLMIKDQGIHDGFYGIGFKMQVATGMIGPTKETTYPGAMFGVSGVRLDKASEGAPRTVDASIVNPPKRSKSSK